MIELNNGMVNLDKLEVTDIIDIRVLQDFLDNFALGMNCAAVCVDREGKEITSPSHYREFCNNYIHMSSIGDARCATCHHDMGEKAVHMGRPYIGSCHANMVDFACPIVIKGCHLGTVLGGQILDSQPKEDVIKRTAKDLNLSPDALWTAAQRIDVVPQKNIQAAADVLFIVVNGLAENGYNKLEIEILSKALTNNFRDISSTIGTLTGSAQEMSQSQNKLSEKISEVSTVAKEISDVLKSIAKIISQTKLLGLNASIEAARLGNDGRTFAVVAKEIHTLSESSNDTVIKIDVLNEQIREKIDFTIQDSTATVTNTNKQTEAMENLQKMVNSSVVIAKNLEDLFQ
ncbi:methyl-accepting chemotaxis protein 4 [Anaerotignum neopropionicum]|uniref:Methyl-accepting chemotaxis protein 4 n=1 Tax=Anaerotignum neopropionicum TaxID=36847 RepID=A0A136WIZ1_9FIRM|nr:PocR ligand-binding domain-containing protein [Anaerotignum neopropionicum]KXL54512.1 methyl-accepting chemotaxis protein 4 [Anaerotignum neopropionicum]